MYITIFFLLIIKQQSYKTNNNPFISLLSPRQSPSHHCSTGDLAISDSLPVRRRPLEQLYLPTTQASPREKLSAASLLGTRGLVVRLCLAQVARRPSVAVRLTFLQLTSPTAAPICACRSKDFFNWACGSVSWNHHRAPLPSLGSAAIHWGCHLWAHLELNLA